MKPWNGRFTADVDPDLERFSSSLAEDRRLVTHDILGSLAHVRTLEQAGLVDAEEARRLQEGLRTVHRRLVDGDAELDPALEDVHMNVESLLGDEVGEVAGKLHAGRSRNDQVALDLRLWTREAAVELGQAVAGLVEALLSKAADHVETPMAARTHRQPAQPTTLGHHLHGHAVRLVRDVEAAADVVEACQTSPLGAAAVAGTTLPTDPSVARDLLGFDATFANATDAVQDRDFAADAVYAAARTAVHLSGLAEELVHGSDPAVKTVELPEALTTGSSIMPQKRNPDAAELVRAAAGQTLGDLTGLLGVLDGLGAGYHRDLQQTKPPLLAALSRVPQAAGLLADVVAGARWDADRLAAELTDELLMTDLAEHLVEQGVPFRIAHRRVGELVAEAEETGGDLADLAEERWPGAADVFDLDRSLAARVHGPAPGRVAEKIEAARSDLSGLRADLDAHEERFAAVQAKLLGPSAPT